MASDCIVRPAAYVLLRDADRILLCRLSQQAQTHNRGKWTLPGGGLDFGEHPEDGAKREALEETGLEVELTSNPWIDSEVVEANGVNWNHLRFLYPARIAGGELRHEANGTTDLCAWVSPAETAPSEMVGIAQLGIKLLFPVNESP